MNSITGKSKKLALSLKRKLNQRGNHDPEVAFVKAERRAIQAADTVRELIDRTYQDAEQVKEQIRQMLDATGILETNDAIVGLNAEAAFYEYIMARIERGELIE